MEQILINLVAGALGGVDAGKSSPTFDLLGHSLFSLGQPYQDMLRRQLSRQVPAPASCHQVERALSMAQNHGEAIIGLPMGKLAPRQTFFALTVMPS